MKTKSKWKRQQNISYDWQGRGEDVTAAVELCAEIFEFLRLWIVFMWVFYIYGWVMLECEELANWLIKNKTNKYKNDSSLGLQSFYKYFG